MSTSEDVAIVADWNQSSEGYYVFTVRLHTPFDFHYLRFNIWNAARVKYTEGEEAKPGGAICRSVSFCPYCSRGVRVSPSCRAHVL